MTLSVLAPCRINFALVPSWIADTLITFEVPLIAMVCAPFGATVTLSSVWVGCNPAIILAKLVTSLSASATGSGR